MARQTLTLQKDGTVTLPDDFRQKYGLKAGDVVDVIETEWGLLISSREQMLDNLLDELGEGLREKQVSLEELIEDGRIIRKDLLKEMYGIDVAE